MPTIPNPPYHTPDHNNVGWLEWFRTHKHRPIPKYIYPTSIAINGGFGTIASGTVADLATLGGNAVVINETATTPGFRVDINFAIASNDTRKPIGVVARCLYDGNTAHDVFVGSFDSLNAVVTRSWTIPSGAGYWHDISWNFPLYSNFYRGNNFILRIEHTSAGSAGHIFRIDYCALLYLEDE